MTVKVKQGWKLIYDIFIWIEFIITLLIAFITYKTLWLQGRRYLSCARGQKPNWRIKIKIELGSLLGCPSVFYILPVRQQNLSQILSQFSWSQFGRIRSWTESIRLKSIIFCQSSELSWPSRKVDGIQTSKKTVYFQIFLNEHPIESLLETNLSEYAIHDVSAVLKELLRHLPEPLFPYKTYHDVIEILQYRQSPLFRLKELNHLIKQLSEVRRYVIGKILYHLAVISSKSNHNRMNSKSLGWFSKLSGMKDLESGHSWKWMV